VKAPYFSDDMKLETQVTGNIGMYYAWYRLSCMGWKVMQTARNAGGIVDAIAYNKSGTESKKRRYPNGIRCRLETALKGSQETTG
jgi:hypothetical protein